MSRTNTLSAALARDPAAAVRRRLGRVAVYAALTLASLTALVPFLYIVSSSLKNSSELFQYPPQWIPKGLYWGNYHAVLFDQQFVRWTLNTLFVAGCVTAIKLVMDSMAGYAFAKMEFAGKRALFGTVFCTVMIPPAVLIIPLYFIVRDLGWLNTYWVLIIPPLANPIGVLMMRGFIVGLPQDIERAARLDNCGELQIFWRIILPLVRPGLVVVGIYTFLIQYTSFVWPLVTINDPDKYVLTLGLANLKLAYTVNWGQITAASVLAMVPVTIVFLLFQRQFVQASVAGALKE